MELDLSGRVVLVSGAASGIGRACALALAENGAQVGLLDIDGRSVASLAGRLGRRHGVEFPWVVTDVAEEFEVAAAVRSMAARLGGIDVVVAAAREPAGRRDVSLTEMDTGDFDRVLAVNVRGVFLLAKHAVPHLEHGRNPVIVLVGADPGMSVSAGHVAYFASMGALPQLTRAMSADLAQRGIRVNCVCPVADAALPHVGRRPGGGTGPDRAMRSGLRAVDQVLWLSSPQSAAVNGIALVTGRRSSPA